MLRPLSFYSSFLLSAPGVVTMTFSDVITSAPFAQAQGAATDSFYETADGTAAGWWWLRSPGFSQAFAAYVFSDGTLSYTLVQDGSGTVRPALWVKFDAGIF